MLVDIDGGPREVADFFLMETADAYQDIEPQCEDLPYLYTATEVLGIFVGKLDDQGQLIAALEEPLTWNDALFMCMRMICGGEGVFDPIYRDGLNRDINFLINYAQRNGCINYNLNGEIGLKVQYDDLSNAVTMRELCMLVYRILQTPIVANAMGGPYTKYLIDNFIK